MPNYTIYIAASNDKEFKAEENKSGLVNELLDRHYRKNSPLSPNGEDVYTAKKLVPMTPPDSGTTRRTLEETAFQIKPEAFQKRQESRGTCKNGHILGLNGKCLQKGCKYA